jgi:hypothetical protein
MVGLRVAETTMNVLENAALGFCLLTLAVCFAFFGRKLLVALKQLVNSTKNAQYHAFLKRVNYLKLIVLIPAGYYIHLCI